MLDRYTEGCVVSGTIKSAVRGGLIVDIDGIEAIHRIQENMGITGTTAKEAEQTISNKKIIVRTPVAMYVERVYPEADFEDLGI